MRLPVLQFVALSLLLLLSPTTPTTTEEPDAAPAATPDSSHTAFVPAKTEPKAAAMAATQTESAATTDAGHAAFVKADPSSPTPPGAQSVPQSVSPPPSKPSPFQSSNFGVPPTTNPSSPTPPSPLPTGFTLQALILPNATLSSTSHQFPYNPQSTSPNPIFLQSDAMQARHVQFHNLPPGGSSNYLTPPHPTLLVMLSPATLSSPEFPTTVFPKGAVVFSKESVGGIKIRGGAEGCTFLEITLKSDCALSSTTNACGDDADSCLLPSIPAAVWKPLKDLFTDPTKRIQSLLCVATTVLSGGLWHVMFKLAPYRLMIPLTAAPAILGTSYWVFFKVMAQWDNYQFRTRGRARSREVTPAHDMPHHKETEAGFGEEREPAEREKARDEKKQRSEDMNAAAAGGG